MTGRPSGGAKTEDEEGWPVIGTTAGNPKTGYPKCPACEKKLGADDHVLVKSQWWHDSCYQETKS